MRTRLKPWLLLESEEPVGGVKVLHPHRRDRNRSLPLLITLTEAAARWTSFVAFFLRGLGFSEVWADNQLIQIIGLKEKLGGWSQIAMDGVHHHKLTPCLFALGWRDVNRFIRAKFSLVAQIISQVCVNRAQPIHHRDSRRLEISSLGLISLRLSLKGFFVIGEARIASPERVASQSETAALILLLEANLGLSCRAFPLSEVRIASLLAPSGALFLASHAAGLSLGAVSEATLNQ